MMVKLKCETQPWEELRQEGSRYRGKKGKDPKADTVSKLEE